MNQVLRRVRDNVLEKFKDQGVTVDDIEDALNAQFSFVVKVMKAGKWERIRLMYLGTFLVTERRKTYLIKRHEEKKRISAREGTQDSPEE